MKNIYTILAKAIIEQQEYVVGSLAWVEAEKVKGLTISNHTVKVKGEGKKAVESLIKQYENLFGGASVEVCRGAVKNLIVDMEKSEVPDILQ
jgi:hypothetical protein